MNHAESYINELLQRNRATLADAVKNTINDIVPQYIENFSYREHVVSLLMGNVQSGKTSHMFGLIAAAADQGFNIFVLLTTDNTLLQEQTFKRALADLDTSRHQSPDTRLQQSHQYQFLREAPQTVPHIVQVVSLYSHEGQPSIAGIC